MQNAMVGKGKRELIALESVTAGPPKATPLTPKFNVVCGWLTDLSLPCYAPQPTSQH